MESEITTLAEENKSLSKSIDQSKQNITQKEEEKAESNKEVAETTKEVIENNNVENQGNANGTINSDGSLNLDKLKELGFGGPGQSAGQGILDGSSLGQTHYESGEGVTAY